MDEIVKFTGNIADKYMVRSTMSLTSHEGFLNSYVSEHPEAMILLNAHRKFLQSRARFISNSRYWENTVDKFESDKLSDHTLDPHIDKFLSSYDSLRSTLLEIGCGIGRAADIIIPRVSQYTGIDVAQSAINNARARFSHTNANFDQADILTYTPPIKFNSVIATDVLLYLSPKGQMSALRNIYSLLKPGAPILLRWAPGNDEFLIKEKPTPTGKVSGWVFLASESYIEQLLQVTGFNVGSIMKETVRINGGTESEKSQEYLLVNANRSL